MRGQWSCPDLNPPPRDCGLVIAGSDEEFPDCPSYYLRTADMEMPAEHLIEGTTHPAQIISEHAMEVETGARSVTTMSPKVRDLVHVFLREKGKRDDHDRKMREKARGR